MAIRIADNLLAVAISYVRSLTQRRTFFMKIERSPRLAPNPLLRAKRTSQIAGGMSASLIGRFGSSAFRRSTSTVSMSSRARASLRNRHQGPSIMGFENEMEQSIGRPCRQMNGRSSGHCDLTSSIVP